MNINGDSNMIDPHFATDPKGKSDTDIIEKGEDIDSDTNDNSDSAPESNHPDKPNDFETKEEDGGNWFIRNNPLYLLSVLMMLTGLYLVDTGSDSGGMGLNTVMMFFGIQNVYEIVMVAMALYLLSSKIQPRHGKLLLIFVLIFLADLTFYQVRISGMSVYAGKAASTIYLILGLIKLAAVIKILRIKIWWDRIFYIVAAFSLIWFAPKYIYSAIEAVGRNAKGAKIAFDGYLEVYSIWIVAALIHLPTIVVNWWHSKLDEPVEHELLGDETSFWRWLMLVPFLLLPFQLIQNVMNDASSGAGHTLPLIPNMIPWILFAIFFAQAMFRKKINEAIEVNVYDALNLTILGVVALANQQPHEVFRFLYYMNSSMIGLALLITFISRKNILSGSVLCAAASWFFGTSIINTADKVVSYGQSLGKQMWALILMVLSFLFLGLGFLVSIKTSKKQPPDTPGETETPS